MSVTFAPDDVAGDGMAERMAAGGSVAGWLFGRRTYEGPLGWNEVLFKEALSNSPICTRWVRMRESSPGVIHVLDPNPPDEGVMHDQ